jgi:hypothetical protein
MRKRQHQFLASFADFFLQCTVQEEPVFRQWYIFMFKLLHTAIVDNMKNNLTYMRS